MIVAAMRKIVQVSCAVQFGRAPAGAAPAGAAPAKNPMNSFLARASVFSERTTTYYFRKDYVLTADTAGLMTDMDSGG